MSNFIKSTNVKMFPSGFRGIGYSESKLTTEQNLTRLKMLSSYKDLNKYVCEDPDDSNKIIIYLGGYYFNIDKSAIADLTEGKTDKSLFAYIKLREIDGVGKVLANLGGSLPEVLDTTDSADTSIFEGLRFCSNKDSIEADGEGYEAGDFYIQVLNSEGNLETNILKLSSKEISDTNTNDTPISLQFTTDKLRVKNITSNDKENPLIIDNNIQAGEKAIKLNGNIAIKNDITISADTNIFGQTSVSSSTLVEAPVEIKSSLSTVDDKIKVNGKIVELSGDINLPSNNSDEVDKALTQRKSINTWMKISESSKPSTLVKRGNDGSITSSTFKGNVVGDVEGNVTGNVVGNITGDLTGKVNDVIIKKEIETAAESIKILPKDENAEYGVKVTGKLEINKDGSLLVGKPNSESNINISNNFISNQSIKIDEKGASYNDYLIKPTGNYVLPNDGAIDETNDTALVKSAGSVNKKWIKISSKSGEPNAIVMTDDKGNINVQATGVIDNADEAKKVSKIKSTSEANLPILLGGDNENSATTPLFANADIISITPNTGTIKSNNIISNDITVNNVKDMLLKTDISGKITAADLSGSIEKSDDNKFITKITQGKDGKITAVGTAEVKLATSNLIGGLKANNLSETGDKIYEAKIDSAGFLKVSVPWKNTTYNIATADEAGLVMIGYTKPQGEDYEKTYPVELDDANKMFVNIPWINTTYTLATRETAGLICADTGTSYSSNSDRSYVLHIDSSSGAGFVIVPWENTTYDLANGATAGLIKAAISSRSSSSDYPDQSKNEYALSITSRSDSRSMNGIGFVQVPNATSSVSGVVKASSTTKDSYNNNLREYGVETTSNGTAFVTIPWESYQVYTSPEQGVIFLQKNNGTSVTSLRTALLSDLGTTGNPTFAIVTATKFQTSSDLRLKENIRDFKYEKSILDLPIKRFDYKNSENKNNIGCIAQDLQKLYPELVLENKDGYLSVEETKLVYLLIEEMKLMKKEINELKKKVG